jgi:hypothetical protein
VSSTVIVYVPPSRSNTVPDVGFACVPVSLPIVMRAPGGELST